MEVWNGIWKKILVGSGIWNGRFLVWNGNGMEENCQYGMWKYNFPFHTIPCPAFKTRNETIRLNVQLIDSVRFHCLRLKYCPGVDNPIILQ